MLLIGKITRTRGNRGELIVSLAPGASAPRTGSQVELRSSRRVQPYTVEGIALSPGEAVLSLSGVDGIPDALRLVGCELWADGPPAAAGDDPGLLGFRVFDRQGDCWGTVVSQPRFSLNQVLEVAEEGTGRTILVPWHPELVVRVDRPARILVIDPPPGLRELNR